MDSEYEETWKEQRRQPPGSKESQGAILTAQFQNIPAGSE